MGCGESKIKEINLTPENPTKDEIDTISNGKVTMNGGKKLDPDEMLPNRLLSAIPVSDLGDSLDSRHLGESLNLGQSFSSKIEPPNSADSTDSGYDEYDEEYSHIITEHSPPELVKKVEDEFFPVQLPEFLVITGRACARILSGYQKNKLEESKILDSLREEGLLAKPKGKTAGGLSFEVVDAAVVNDNMDVDAVEDGKRPDAFISAKFIPKKKLERLENRRSNIRKPSARIEERLAEAEERRKAQESEKVKLVLERSGLERHNRMRTASAVRRENKYSATVAKRQQQLQEMRDKLKEKHKKNEMIKLKHQLNNEVESGFVKGSDNFFDD